MLELLLVAILAVVSSFRDQAVVERVAAQAKMIPGRLKGRIVGAAIHAGMKQSDAERNLGKRVCPVIFTRRGTIESWIWHYADDGLTITYERDAQGAMVVGSVLFSPLYDDVP